MVFKRRCFLAGVLFCGLAASACKPAEAAKLPDPGKNAGTLLLTTDPVGALITIDGVSVGNSPQNVRLKPGPHRIKVRKSGYFAKESRLQIKASVSNKKHIPLVASH